MNHRIIQLASVMLALLIAGAAAFAEDLPLLAGEDRRVAVTVSAAEGLMLAPEMAVAGDTPEYYFIPEDGAGPLRFVYYTTGSGDPMALAKAALGSYAMLYDSFSAGGIREDPVAGRTCLHFDYACSYPDRSGARQIHEQTAVAYLPLSGDQFVACIVSLAFDDPDARWTTEALDNHLMSALERVRMAD